MFSMKIILILFLSLSVYAKDTMPKENRKKLDLEIKKLESEIKQDEQLLSNKKKNYECLKKIKTLKDLVRCRRKDILNHMKIQVDNYEEDTGEKVKGFSF